MEASPANIWDQQQHRVLQNGTHWTGTCVGDHGPTGHPGRNKVSILVLETTSITFAQPRRGSSGSAAVAILLHRKCGTFLVSAAQLQ